MTTTSKHRILGLLLGWSLLVWAVFSTVSLVWVSFDAQPQGCDQAHHLIRSLELSSGLRSLDPGQLWSWWLEETGEGGVYTYPPLYHVVTALFLLVAPRPALAAVLANLGFVWLLVVSLVRIGRSAFDLTVGVSAAFLAALFPILAQFQHEAFIDFALTGTTSWCVWRLLATEGFQNRKASIAWGVSLGLGLLLKQQTPLYLLGPAVALLWTYRRAFDLTAWKNLGLSISTTLVCALPWYALHWKAIAANAAFNQRIAVLEGDPMPWTLLGALFYPHAMASLQVGFGVFVVAVCSGAWLGVMAMRGRTGSTHQRASQLVVAAWLLVGLALLTFAILNKDVRYSMPVLPAVALIAASPLFWLRTTAWRVAFVALLGVFAVPYYTHILFSWPPLHRSFALRTGPLWWMVWNDSYYYGAAPKTEDWHLSEILALIEHEREGARDGEPIRLALVPFLLRLNTNSVRLEALQRGISVEVVHVGSDERFAATERISSCDFVLTKTGDDGLPFATTQADRIENFIAENPERFQVLQAYPFPDGSTGTLSRVVR